MNIIAKSVSTITRICLGKTIEGSSTALTKCYSSTSTAGSILSTARKYLENPILGFQQIREASLLRMHKTGPRYKKRKNKNPLGDKPFAKGVVLKTLIKKPKKPNSANRKCVLVRLSTGKEMTAYVPGEGHSLQEHNIVLVRPGRCKDVPGVKIKCVRGVYDLPHVIKKFSNFKNYDCSVNLVVQVYTSLNRFQKNFYLMFYFLPNGIIFHTNIFVLSVSFL